MRFKTSQLAAAIAAVFLVSGLPACAFDADAPEQVSAMGQAVTPPQGGKPPPPKPPPPPAPKPGQPKPAPVPGGSKKPGKTTTQPKKPGTSKPAPGGGGAKPKGGKTGKTTTQWSAAKVTTRIGKITIIGTGIIGAVTVFIEKIGDAIVDLATVAKNVYEKLRKLWAGEPMPPPPPPGDDQTAVNCAPDGQDWVCTFVVEGPCDPDTVGFGVECINPVQVCEHVGEGGCDPDAEDCCGDDTFLYCEADPAGSCEGGGDNPCCLAATALPVDGGEGDTVYAPAMVCDTSGGLVDANTPGACGPTVEVEVCEPVGDTNFDGLADLCIELPNGTALGGGACCGDSVASADICVCEVEFCDEADPTQCATVQLPDTYHECSNSSFCAQFDFSSEGDTTLSQ